MNLIAYLFRQSWRLFLFSTVTGLLSGISGAGLAIIIGKGIGDIGQASTFAWMFFGLCFATLILKSGSELSLLQVTQRAILGMRIDLSRRLLATPFKKLQDMGKSELLVILTNDIGAFIEAFQMMPMAFGNGIIIAVSFVYMAWLSLELCLVFLALLFAGIAAYHLLEKIPLPHMSRLRDQMDVLYRHFRGLIEGTRELQLNRKRGRMFIEDSIARSATDFKRIFVKAMSGYTWVSNISSLMFYLAIGACLFIVPLWLPQKPETIVSFTVILLYLIGPISQMMSVLPALRQAGVSLKRIEQLGRTLAEEQSTETTGPDPFAGAEALRLDLSGVCHQYPGPTEDSHFMLGPVDLMIRQGELIYIVGGNGSGKTTLAMLLLGMYRPEAGSITLNGVAVTDSNIDHYRQYFSAVFSDFHLFEQLICDDPARPDVRAAHYLKEFGIQHKVRVVDGKFSTIDLSTGQRKRLALISAYLEDRPIYLFDEWAADQDPVFKRIFYAELLPELKARGKTVIVITHDDAYFGFADRIIKLEDGRLQTAGPEVMEDAFSRNTGNLRMSR